MSEMQEFSASKAEGASQESFDSIESALLGKTKYSNLEGAQDMRGYSLGEVPQEHLLDPQGFLPLNSDRLVGSVNVIEKTLAEAQNLIQEEVSLVQKHQKKIHEWEDRIEKNKLWIQKNQMQVKQNLIDIAYDKKNRDYWMSRAEHVLLDFDHTQASNRENDWSWLIKKYGLKNPDGTEVDSSGPCVEEICQGAAQNLAGEYKIAGNKYEMAKKEKELHNTQMIQENSRLLSTNEKMQGFIATIYAQEIEPLQDGILLLKELSVKMKALAQEGNKATYGDLRIWAETFLDEFLRINPRTPRGIVVEFRRLSSMPLPSENS